VNFILCAGRMHGRRPCRAGRNLNCRGRLRGRTNADMATFWPSLRIKWRQEDSFSNSPKHDPRRPAAYEPLSLSNSDGLLFEALALGESREQPLTGARWDAVLYLFRMITVGCGVANQTLAGGLLDPSALRQRQAINHHDRSTSLCCFILGRRLSQDRCGSPCRRATLGNLPVFDLHRSTFRNPCAAHHKEAKNVASRRGHRASPRGGRE
jgi:hypothetical protein